jgi:hypothetical protein
MGKVSTFFLKLVILFIALIVFVGMIRFPQTEGRAANLDLVSIYKDPFIIYIYLSSIPFFIALYQGIKLLGNAEKYKFFTPLSVSAVKKIKYCALILIAEVIAAMVFIRLNSGDDDPAGAIAMGILVTFVFIVIATTASVFEGLLHDAVKLKSKK